MAKCFFTGVEVALSETYLLNLGLSIRILRDLRQKTEVIERLLEQLGPRDVTEIYDSKKRKKILRKDRRLVSKAVAKVLSDAYPEKNLFINWMEWRGRTPKITKYADSVKSYAEKADNQFENDDLSNHITAF